MKKIIALLMALLLTTALTACGGSAKSEAADSMMMNGYQEYAEEPKEESSGSITTTGAAGSYATDQKLIREVSVTAETEDLETLLSQLSQEITALGGYTENQEVYSGGSYNSYRSRSAQLTVRIPAEKLDSFIGQVRGVSNVVSFSESAQDVTLTYVATESQVSALEAEEERLLELMDKAETMSDLLEVEARLTEVRSQLEVTASQLRVLANKVSYATVYLYLEQVKVLTETEYPTPWQRISSGFRENIQDIGDGLVDFFVWAATYSPQLIFWGLVLTAAFAVLRRKLRTHRARGRTTPPENQA